MVEVEGQLFWGEKGQNWLRQSGLCSFLKDEKGGLQITYWVRKKAFDFFAQ